MIDLITDHLITNITRKYGKRYNETICIGFNVYI